MSIKIYECGRKSLNENLFKTNSKIVNCFNVWKNDLLAHFKLILMHFEYYFMFYFCMESNIVYVDLVKWESWDLNLICRWKLSVNWLWVIKCGKNRRNFTFFCYFRWENGFFVHAAWIMRYVISERYHRLREFAEEKSFWHPFSENSVDFPQFIQIKTLKNGFQKMVHPKPFQINWLESPLKKII